MPRDTSAKVIECAVCSVRYSLRDVDAGDFQIDTLVCSACYRKMQLMDYSKSCFGKPTKRTPGGRVYWGFDPAADECSHLCPDRAACRRVMGLADFRASMMSVRRTK